MGHDFRSKLTVSWRVSPVFRLKVVHGKLHGDITHVLWYHSSLLYMLYMLLLLLVVVVVVVFTFFQSHTSLFDWTQHIHYHSLLMWSHVITYITCCTMNTYLTYSLLQNEVSMNRLWSIFSPCALRCLGAKDQQAKHQSQIAHLHHVGQVLRERNHFEPRGPPSSRRTASIESPYEGIHHGIVPVSFQLIHTDPHMSMLCNPISLWL